MSRQIKLEKAEGHYESYILLLLYYFVMSVYTFQSFVILRPLTAKRIFWKRLCFFGVVLFASSCMDTGQAIPAKQ